MTTSEKCLTCPRGVKYRHLRDHLEEIHETLTAGSGTLLDDSEALEYATVLHAYGLIEDPTDAQAVRDLAAQGFEALDLLETALDNERTEETRFCIGALKLRAKDTHTQYDVTICRSPKVQTTHGDLAEVVLERRSIR